MHPTVRSYLLVLPVGAACLLLSAAGVSADVVYTNGSGTCANCGSLTQGSNVPPSGFYANAEAFTPSASYQLTSAEANLNTFAGTQAGGTANYYIYSGSGNAPVSLVAFIGSAVISQGAAGTFTAATANGPTLLAGTQYWLVIAPGTATTQFDWGGGVGNVAVPGAFSRDASLNNWAGGYVAAAQFEIDGTLLPTAAPESGSSAILLGIGALGLFALRCYHGGRERSALRGGN